MAPDNSALPTVWIVASGSREAESSRHTLAQTCEARLVADGPSLLASLALGQPPDAIVVDWDAPSAPAGELCRRVRQTHDASRLSIVVLTGARGGDVLRATRDAGADEHVIKPFEEEELALRVRTAIEMKRLRARVRSTADFRTGFLGALGHDLRQPLSTLSMGASVLMTCDLSESDARIARRLHNATQRMTRMIADLFDLARSEVGAGISLDRRPLDFNEACREIVEEAQTANAGRVIVFEASGDGKGEWDRGRIEQACTSLIANALRHGEASAPIVVTIGGDAEHVTLAVASRGPRIPDDLRAALFDPYRATASDGRDARDPLGLGLFLVREIARAHGGSARIESDEVQTVFSVQLPRRHVARSGPVTAEPQPAQSA